MATQSLFIRTAVALAGLALCAGHLPAAESLEVEQWGIFEVELPGPADGNPFVDVQLGATFECGTMRIAVDGFYDGDGRYRIRFMPPQQATWQYTTASNRAELAGKSGSFEAVAPTGANHGPVQVHRTWHFQYSDGTPYYPFGTTCYAWTHQSKELERETLATLKTSPFNKLRMCVFPKWYTYNRVEPQRYPFEGTPPARWDFTRFNPEFFRHLENQVAALRELGIEADLILLHPYDGGHWGFDRMDADTDERYLRYLVARLAAYRNVWWSLANEYDLLTAKEDSDWDRFFEIIAEHDPYQHLRSIHNCRTIYNHTLPLVTHASIQNGSAVEDVGRAQFPRDIYRKPIVYDEVKYEGDVPERWGNLSAEEMMHRCWVGAVAGTYVGHGETYRSPDEVLWWSKGGRLLGQSPPRIAFLRKIVEQGPAQGLEPIDKWQDLRTAGNPGEYYLLYFGKETPTEWKFELPAARSKEPMKVSVEVIDAWNMTVTPLEGVFELSLRDRYTYVCQKSPTLVLPGKPYIALRIRHVQ